MKKNDLYSGLFVGFSIGLVFAILTTPIEGVLCSNAKNKSVQQIVSSFVNIIHSTNLYKKHKALENSKRSG